MHDFELFVNKRSRYVHAVKITGCRAQNIVYNFKKSGGYEHIGVYTGDIELAHLREDIAFVQEALKNKNTTEFNTDGMYNHGQFRAAGEGTRSYMRDRYRKSHQTLRGSG